MKHWTYYRVCEAEDLVVAHLDFENVKFSEINQLADRLENLIES